MHCEPRRSSRWTHTPTGQLLTYDHRTQSCQLGWGFGFAAHHPAGGQEWRGQVVHVQLHHGREGVRGVGVPGAANRRAADGVAPGVRVHAARDRDARPAGRRHGARGAPERAGRVRVRQGHRRRAVRGPPGHLPLADHGHADHGGAHHPLRPARVGHHHVRADARQRAAALGAVVRAVRGASSRHPQGETIRCAAA